MAKLPIALACGPYDRTRALADGRVPVEGVDLRYVTLDPEEIFFRMTQFQEFDVAELSLSSYLITHLADGPFVAIPVFPSRMFRHTSVYVNAAAGIETPAQLAGRKVGVAEYQLTANVWVRGIFEDYYDLPVSDVKYRTGGLNQPGRKEKISLSVSGDIEPIAADATLSDLLVEGEIDAIYSPRAPDAFLSGRPEVRRLFPNARHEEERYFREAGVFPIMHVIVMKRAVYEANPWLARSLTKAFVAAKALAEAELRRTVALSVMLPWVREELDATVALMGDDFWPYGVKSNHQGLEVFAKYSYDQGLVASLAEPEGLFAGETLDEVII